MRSCLHVRDLLREVVLFNLIHSFRGEVCFRYQSRLEKIALIRAALCEVYAPSFFTEGHLIESQMLLVRLSAAQVECVREQRVGRMVAGELFLEDEQMINIVEDSVEIGGQETRFNYLGHLRVALPVQFEYLVRVY